MKNSIITESFAFYSAVVQYSCIEPTVTQSDEQGNAHPAFTYTNVTMHDNDCFSGPGGLFNILMNNLTLNIIDSKMSKNRLNSTTYP